jgi:peptidoglycan hydrolase CwlO-like protein
LIEELSKVKKKLEDADIENKAKIKDLEKSNKELESKIKNIEDQMKPKPIEPK